MTGHQQDPVTPDAPSCRCGSDGGSALVPRPRLQEPPSAVWATRPGSNPPHIFWGHNHPPRPASLFLTQPSSRSVTPPPPEGLRDSVPDAHSLTVDPSVPLKGQANEMWSAEPRSAPMCVPPGKPLPTVSPLHQQPWTEPGSSADPLQASGWLQGVAAPHQASSGSSGGSSVHPRRLHSCPAWASQLAPDLSRPCPREGTSRGYSQELRDGGCR